MVPIANSAVLAAKLVRCRTLKVHPGGSHGVCVTSNDQVNADLLAFCRS